MRRPALLSGVTWTHYEKEEIALQRATYLAHDLSSQRYQTSSRFAEDILFIKRNFEIVDKVYYPVLERYMDESHIVESLSAPVETWLEFYR